MRNWFNVLYTLKKDFKSLADLNETIDVSKKLTDADSTNNQDERNSKRLGLIKDYFAKNIGLTVDIVRDRFREAIEGCQKLSQDAINDIYTDLPKYKMDGTLEVYAQNIAYLRKFGIEFVEKGYNVIIESEKVDPIDVDEVRDIQEKINNTIATQEKTIQDGVEIYYMLFSDKDHIIPFNTKRLWKDDDGILNIPKIVMKILEKVTNTELNTDFNLASLIQVLKDSNLSTDVDFIHYLNTFNQDNLLSYDKNMFESYNNQISNIYKDSTYFCHMVKHSIEDIKLLKNYTSTEIDAVKKALNKTNRKKNLESILDLIQSGISPEPKFPEPTVINESNIKQAIKEFLPIINDIIAQYDRYLKVFVAQLNELSENLKNNVDLKTNSNITPPKYSLENVIKRWHAFANSAICSKDNQSYQISYNRMRDNAGCENLDYKFVPLDQISANTEADIFSNDLKFNMLTIFKVINIKGTINQIFDSLVNSKADIECNAQYFDIAKPNDPKKKDAISYYKVVLVNAVLKYLRAFFGERYNTQLTFARGSQNSSNLITWYHVTCNLIYRSDYVVEEFIMYRGKYIITEDADPNEKYLDNVLSDINKKYPEFDKVKNSEERLKYLIDYVNSENKEENSSEEKKSSKSPINNNSAGSSELAVSTENVEKSLKNYTGTNTGGSATN